MEKGFFGALVYHILIMGVYIGLGYGVNNLNNDYLLVIWPVVCLIAGVIMIVMGIRFFEDRGAVGEDSISLNSVDILRLLPGIFIVSYTLLGLLSYFIGEY